MTTKKKDSAIPKFLLKIYEMLENDFYDEYVSWNKEGTAMVIKRPTEFAATVLPVFFKHSNLASFIRQLNMYNFKKQKSQDFECVYAHDLFCRGKKNQLGYILRKGVDSTIPVHAESTSESLPKKAEKLRKEESQDELTVLMNENKRLKRNEEFMTVRLKEMENKISELNHKNESLLSQTKKQSMSESQLKYLLSTIAAVHGPSFIRNTLEYASKKNMSREQEQDSCLDPKLLLPGFDFGDKSESVPTMMDEYYPRQSNYDTQTRRRSGSFFSNGQELSLTRYDSGPYYFNEQYGELQRGTNDSLQAFAGGYPYDLDGGYNFGADLC